MDHVHIPVFGRIKATQAAAPAAALEPAPKPRGGWGPRLLSFEAGVKLTQLLHAGYAVDAALIRERFEVSEPTAYAWISELIELLPVEVLRQPAGRRGTPPRVLRLNGMSGAPADPENGRKST
jgi:hypothetical protein